jgi:hypothetical protein
MTDQTINKLVLDAVLTTDDFGYPDDVAFVPYGESWTDKAVLRYLSDGTATVLAIDGFEIMIRPRPKDSIMSIWLRLSGRQSVDVVWRPIDGHSPIAPMKTTVGKHPSRELVHRELVGA